MLLKILSKTPLNYEDGTFEFYSCIVEDRNNDDEKSTVVLHIYQVEIFELLEHFGKSLNLYPATINEMWLKIEKYGDYKRNEKIFNSIKETL